MDSSILLNLDVLEQLSAGEIIKLCNISKSNVGRCLADDNIRFILANKMMDGLEYVIDVERKDDTFYSSRIKRISFDVEIIEITDKNSIRFEIGDWQLESALEEFNEIFFGERDSLRMISSITKSLYNPSTNNMTLTVLEEPSMRKRKLDVPLPLLYELVSLIEEENRSFTLYVYEDKNILFVDNKDFNILSL
jgi:hypothetical protein